MSHLKGLNPADKKIDHLKILSPELICKCLPIESKTFDKILDKLAGLWPKKEIESRPECYQISERLFLHKFVIYS